MAIFFSDVPNSEKNFTDLLEIETELLEIETDLPQIDIALSEIETGLPSWLSRLCPV